MQAQEYNEQGCPLRNQQGSDGVKDFAAILARLAPEQYAAFQAERAARQDELNQYVTRYGYRT
ncbi:hypothetical protein SE17_02820 [Kouleothrix aurantiaca]|jgi:hypothetical protein|uniref:Uncharacterized protein n=1 Tax=Kouleothrix aurantiaca TaxID=186479 RepID=A0A0N8PT56_9CHLR|nr:hypothetical protein SE17_02820 [Kouleothrix aurantiaca]